MKILHVQQYFNEGMGYQENLFPYYQQKIAREVVLITSTRSDGFNNTSRVKKEGQFVENKFKVKRVKIKGEFKGRFVIFDNLYKILEIEKPDYIFHHGVTAPSIKTVCDYKKNNPNVFLATDNHADLNISGRNKLWKIIYYNLFWKKIIKKYDKYIDIYFGVTPSRCLFMNEELGISNEKIRLLPIGADTDNIKSKTSISSIVNQFNIDEEFFLIAHGGKITSNKQAYQLLKAFSNIENDKIRLIIFGSVQDKVIKEMMNKDSRILFLGWLNRSDTLELLKLCDIGIWNFQHTTLLEDCVAAGLPMILRYYGSTCHLINGSGLYLYTNSIREIQDKLKFVIDNPSLINRFKENAKYMAQCLSYNNIAAESIEYFYSLKCGKIHKEFMSKEFTDINFKDFRKLNQK